MPTNDPLSNLLQSWRHQPPEAPRFQAEVWTRIQSAQTRSESAGIFTGWFGSSTRLLHQAWPIAAVLTVTLSVLAGASAGWVQGHHRAEALQADAYVRSIDPLQMTGSTHP
jgi:hypothetical protein